MVPVQNPRICKPQLIIIINYTRIYRLPVYCRIRRRQCSIAFGLLQHCPNFNLKPSLHSEPNHVTWSQSRTKKTVWEELKCCTDTVSVAKNEHKTWRKHDLVNKTQVLVLLKADADTRCSVGVTYWRRRCRCRCCARWWHCHTTLKHHNASTRERNLRVSLTRSATARLPADNSARC